MIRVATETLDGDLGARVVGVEGVALARAVAILGAHAVLGGAGLPVGAFGRAVVELIGRRVDRIVGVRDALEHRELAHLAQRARVVGVQHVGADVEVPRGLRRERETLDVARATVEVVESHEEVLERRRRVGAAAYEAELEVGRDAPHHVDNAEAADDAVAQRAGAGDAGRGTLHVGRVVRRVAYRQIVQARGIDLGEADDLLLTEVGSHAAEVARARHDAIEVERRAVALADRRERRR